MNNNTTNSSSKARKTFNRQESAEILSLYEKDENLSQRDIEAECGLPRTTLQYWLSRQKNIDVSPVVTNFFESPEGVAFLHRLMTALHFVFVKLSNSSLHKVADFLELSHLSNFVASSYTSQNRLSHEMDSLIVDYGKSQKESLSKNMPAKEITIAEDETFHQGLCLVGLDCTSNFIITEKYVDDRTCDTWSDTLSKDIEGYNVSVIQVVSDEAKALIAHAEKSLGAHHSSDLFHVVQEISKGASLALSSKKRALENDYHKATKNTEQIRIEEKGSKSSDKKPVGRPIDFTKKVSAAKDLEKQALEEFEKAVSNEKNVHKAKRRIGEVYHPINLKTGEIQKGKKVGKLLNLCFNRIYKGTSDLSNKCLDRIDKAKRVLPQMIATIEFFFMMVETIIARENYGKNEKAILMDTLIPSIYLKQVSERTRDPKLKKRYGKKSRKLLKVFELKKYSSQKKEALLRTAEECATVFQRSSSCVEGRNAQLALRHTSIHRMTTVQLTVQTVLHNYTLKRKDGTTAANRFFEQEHDDLFESILNKMSYPSRPRKRLSKAG